MLLRKGGATLRLNHIYSLLNSNSINELLKTPYRNSTNFSYKEYPNFTKDSIAISDIARQLSQAHNRLSSITNINGSEISSLKAVDNSLSFKNNSYYDLNINGTRAIFTTDASGHITMPYKELEIESGSLSPSTYAEIDKIEKFFTYLSTDRSGMLIRLSYSNSETKEMLNNIGIKSGFFTIKNNGNTNEFCLLDDGTLYPKYQSEAHRFALNHTDYFKEGYTSESVFKIDGKEYKLNDNGQLNIPEGVMCLAETMEIIK
jgi:hypothetical protein